MEEFIHAETPVKLKIVKYLIVGHLILFAITSAIAVANGQQFQLWWAFYILYTTFFIIGFSKKKFNTIIIYFTLMFCLISYKFYEGYRIYDIESVYLLLNGAIVLSLLFSIPLICLTRNCFMQNDYIPGKTLQFSKLKVER